MARALLKEIAKRPPVGSSNKPFLPSVALGEEGIDESQLGTVETDRFEGPRSPERFTGPLFLIRENERLQCAYSEAKFLAYRAQIVGITAKVGDYDGLKRLADDFRERRPELAAFCLLRGTRGLASKATAINKTDIDRLPWPRKGESWDISATEKILCEDLLEYMSEFVRRGQNSRLLRTAATPTDFKSYQITFLSALAPVHSDLKAGDSYSLDGLACQMFYFGARPELDWSQDWTVPLRKLVYAPASAAIRTVRILRFYEANVILLVKPDRLRYWIRSVAIRDADETLRDLRRQGF